MATKTRTPKIEPVQEQPFALTVVKVDIDPNLPEQVHNEIISAFLPHYKQLQDMEDEYAAIVGSDVTVHTYAVSKKARELRLKYVAWRGTKGLKGTHEEKKAYYRNVGAAIDKLERTGREAAQEREEKLLEIENFVENQLQEEREEIIKPYLFEGQEARKDLGKMNEDDWEIHFNGIRAIFQAEQEKEAKRQLRESRLKDAAKYALYIENFDEIVWEDLPNKEYVNMIFTAKNTHEKQEKKRLAAEAEAERLQKELQRRAQAEADAIEAAHKAEAERQRKFNSRVASIKGAELREDGIYYKDKRISTIKSIQEKPDEEFNIFLSKHLEKYNADVQAEAEQKAKEEAAEKERQAEAVRIAAENAKLKAEKEAIEQKRREDEEKMAAQKAEAEAKKGAPDREKLQLFRDELANLGYPDCSSAEGIKTVNSIQNLIGKVIGYIDEKLEKI
jgi:hypothetical protein